MSQVERIVVVGAGLAGLRSAERLRELGFNGELMIVGAEGLPPYHRPALSKQLLTGAMRPHDLLLTAYRDLGAKWRLGTSAGYLLPRRRVVRLPGGEEVRYDGLIIATGMEARRLNDVPYHDPRVLAIRTLPDAIAIERAVSSSRGPVAIVGGGFTGCEIAASLRQLNREVAIIGRSKTLLGDVLGPKFGGWLTGLHRNHDVDLAMETTVRQWLPKPEGIELHLSDGTFMLAACVVVAAGTEPATTWLRGSGLPIDNGVVCEATCHVVGTEDVVAAGDVAQWPNMRFDAVPRRVEHWLNAVEMGRAAAESLLAGRAAAQPFTPMPRFWTEQYGVRIQAAGIPKLGTDTVTLGTPNEGTGTVIGYVRDGRLTGVVGLDSSSALLTWTETLSEQNPVPQRQPLPAPVGHDDLTGPIPIIPALTSPAPARAQSGPNTLPPRPPVQRPAMPPQPTNGRMRPVETNGRMRPVETNGRMRPVDTNGRLRPVDTNGRIRPVEYVRTL